MKALPPNFLRCQIMQRMCLLFKPTLAKYVNNYYYLVLIIPTVSIVTKILSYFWLISPTLTRPVYQDLPNREMYSDFSIHFFIQMGKTHESTMNDKITMKIWNNWNFKQLATTNKKLTWKNCCWAPVVIESKILLACLLLPPPLGLLKKDEMSKMNKNKSFSH